MAVSVGSLLKSHGSWSRLVVQHSSGSIWVDPYSARSATQIRPTDLDAKSAEQRLTGYRLISCSEVQASVKTSIQIGFLQL